MSEDIIKSTHDLAEVIREKYSVEYSLEGIETIENHINNQRELYESKSEQEKRFDSYRIGSFIAICFVQNFGATLESHEEYGIAVKIEQNFIFPISKTWKFLNKDGFYESISSFYEVFSNLKDIESIGRIGDNITVTKSSTLERKQWWKFWKK